MSAMEMGRQGNEGTALDGDKISLLIIPLLFQCFLDKAKLCLQLKQ